MSPEENALEHVVVEQTESHRDVIINPDLSEEQKADALNSITIFDAEPIPTLDELLVKIEGAKYFTKIDLTKGYWQIPLAEESKAYTAFQSPRGLMEFNFMPFGLSTAAPTFQRAMQEVLGRLPFIVSYFDDIMVYSNTWLDHVNDLQMALQTIQDEDLTARPKKSLVGFTSIEFLGHIVSRGIIQPDDAKKSKIENITPPTTKKEVQRTCGAQNVISDALSRIH
ncbi:hypothetical protein RRG08_046127 [Elysia crispata]|uniref:Reverse transcriptase domain-containing protein n=1 Tax=Elysia crispata TaxID=231223 RepID=A0AAE1AZK5_9GAST|nr:hypothetical protein RRG08_046127 [Elysia crispata]